MDYRDRLHANIEEYVSKQTQGDFFKVAIVHELKRIADALEGIETAQGGIDNTLEDAYKDLVESDGFLKVCGEINTFKQN